MSYNEVFEKSLNDYDPIIWQDGPIYKKYHFIVDFLSDQLGNEYSSLLALPRIKENNGSWLSKAVSSRSTPLTQLPYNDQLVIRQQLEGKLKKINLLIDSLKAKEDSAAINLGNLLEGAFTIPDYGHIFVDLESRHFCLVVWGYEFKQLAKGNVKKWKLTQGFPTPIVNQDVAKVDEPISSYRLQPTTREEKSTIENISNTKVSNAALGSDIRQKEPQPIEIKENVNRKLVRRSSITWLLGILLIASIITIIFLLFGDDRSSNKLSQILPEKPNVLPPIDTTKIIIDEDDPLKQKIISNRLNIYLSPGTDTKTFAEQLKQRYTDSEVKIVYYTSSSNKLMIEVPEEERNQIKEELSNGFKYVEFVLDEHIFENQQVLSSFNDPGFSDTRKYWPLEDIQAFDAWKITQGDPNIVIAVIDDGFDLSHPELTGKTIHTWNIPENTSKLNIGFAPMIHGTHVAGIAGAVADNLEGIAGVAPNCKLMPIQIGDRFGTMTTSAIVDGLFYALNHDADVINLSLGSSFTGALEGISLSEQRRLTQTLYPQQERFWTKLFKLLYDKGIVVVQAAGNSNLLASIDPMLRNPYTIKVSATNSNRNKASFSNFGKVCNLSAPGTRIFNAVPANGFQYLDGTSMAAPMVSGGAALLLSNYPHLTPNECKDILFDTGLKVDTEIGPLIQLANALTYNAQDKLACQDEIDHLKEEIENLKKRLGSDSSSLGLVIPENPTDLSFADGLWKSTTELFSSISEEPLELYFQFDASGSGEIIILELDGTKCQAPLEVNLFPNKMELEQLSPAMCQSGMGYQPYSVRCISIGNQTANCKAINQIDHGEVIFQLLKVGYF